MHNRADALLAICALDYNPWIPESGVHAAHHAGDAPDAGVVASIAETAQALATGSRVRLLYLLVAGERGVGELAEAAGLAPAAASQQLRVLRHLKLVASRREGQAVRYRLYDDHVRTLLEEMRHHGEHASRGWVGAEPPADRQAAT